MWNKQDPREVLIDYDYIVDIVIVDLATKKIFYGEVYIIDSSWSVFVDNNKDKEYISADDEWPGSWIWTKFPVRSQTK